MAEFQEVMREHRRLCKNGNDCASCNLSSQNNTYGMSCTLFLSLHSDLAEAFIMSWADEHPEPKYPTWKEWFSSNKFPGNGGVFYPCVFQKASCDDCINECENCHLLDKQIPEDIAKKLGIKPLNATELNMED